MHFQSKSTRVSSRDRGLSSVEVIIICAAIGVVVLLSVGVAIPTINRKNELDRRVGCYQHMSGIYKALNTYSVSNRNDFPTMGKATKNGRAVAFQGEQITDAAAEMNDNVTAPFWMIVRDGSVRTDTFVCPSSAEVPQPMAGGAELQRLRDFTSAKHFSYAVMDMFDPKCRMNWSPSTGADWVLYADDNDNDFNGTPGRHTSRKDDDLEGFGLFENSTRHWGDGQNVLYGDGHVSFTRDPYQGPGSDNIYAKGGPTGKQSPPTLSHDDSEGSTDVVLLPIRGNGGVNLGKSK